MNVLLHAMVEQSPHHSICRRELESLRSGSQLVALSGLILAAVVRIATNPRVFRPTPSPGEVFEFVDALRAQPEAQLIEPGRRHWSIFRDLVLAGDIRGPDTPDAYLAALALEHGCEWWTTDRAFARFPGLNWRYLLE